MAKYLNTAFYQVQNSKKGMIELNYSSNGCGFSFTPVFKPISPKDIQPGMKVYNCDAKRFFTLDYREIILVRSLLNEAKTNGALPDYGDTNLFGITVRSTKNTIYVTHYPKDGQSVLALSQYENDGNKGWFISYTLYKNKEKDFNLSMAISDLELKILIEFLEHYPVYKGTLASGNTVSYYANQTDNNSNSSYNNSSNSNSSYNNNSNYNNSNSSSNTNNNSNGTTNDSNTSGGGGGNPLSSLVM